MPKRVPYHRAPGQLAAAKGYERQRWRVEDKGFYGSARWRKLRAMKLRDNPLCEDCYRRGVLTPAEHVHHVKPRKTHPELSFEWTNLEALCVPCHNRKGADGGDR